MSFSSQIPQPQYAWNFEGTNNDYIIGLSPTTKVGTPTYVNGKYGQGINFPNSTNTGTVNAANTLYYTTSLNSSTGYTFTFWVNFNIGGVFAQVFLSVGNSSGGRIMYVYLHSNNQFILGEQTGGGDLNFNNATFSTGTWYHIAVVINNGTRYLYVNGTSVSGASTITGTQAGFIIGGDLPSINNFSSYCSYDDFRIYNIPLTSTQINKIYQTAGMPTMFSLASTPNTPIDTSPNPLNLQSYTTNIQKSSISPFPNENSLLFNGTNSRIYSATCPSKLQINFWTVPWTFEGWVMANVNQNNNAIFLRNDTFQNPCPDIYVYLSATGGLTVSGGTSTTGNWYVAGPATAINTWQYFAVTFDGVNTLKIYTGSPGGNTTLNAQKTDISAGVNGQYNPTTAFIIGSHTGAYLNGKLASLRFTSNAVLYNSTFNVPITPLGIPPSGTVLLSIHGTVTNLIGTPLLNQLSVTAQNAAVSLFSLRALSGSIIRAVQVRRSSDNATQDFYADRLGNLFTSINNGVILNTWLNGATGYVTYWYDQSGAGNHTTQGTAANQPTFSGNTINWGGTNSILLNATNGTNSTTFSLVMYITESLKSYYNQIFATAGSWRTGAIHLLSPQNSRSIQLSMNPATDVQTGFSFTDNQGFIAIYIGTITGGTATITPYFNGTSYTGISSTSVTSFLVQSINLGGWDGDTARTLNGTMNNIFIFNSALGTTDRQYIEGWLAWKNTGSGTILPVGHPYYSVSPTG